MPGTECDGGKDCGREIGKIEAHGEEAGGREGIKVTELFCIGKTE